MDALLHTLWTGAGATLAVDVWALARRRWLGVPLPNYGLVGRWFAHMPGGRFRHASIAAAAAMPGERLLGWSAHYAIGVAFAALLPLICGAAWQQQPSLPAALLVGVGSVAAPFLLMQPAIGLGIAASRAARPGAARWQSLITHAVFGIGLYAAARAANVLFAS
jgi:hypothetical protein